MASVASDGTSPHLGYEYLSTDSNGDLEDSVWNAISIPQSAGSGSVGFFPSPGESMSSWAMVASSQHMAPSPQAPSPLNLDLDNQGSFSPPGFSNAQLPYSSGPSGASLMTNSIGQDVQNFLSPADLLLDEQQLNDWTAALYSPFQTHLSPQHIQHTILPPSLQPPLLDLPQGIPPSIHDDNSWDLPDTKAGSSPIFIIEDPSFVSPSLPVQYSPSAGSPASINSHSPAYIKPQTRITPERKTAAPIPIDKVRGSARVQKRRPASSDSPGSSVGSAASSSKFLIVTPDSVHAHAGKPNPFECFEAMRPSQRGRKGPLANDTKENALQVRRLGACFCCHARKVKCDKERPCRNCKKLTVQVSQVICWQFQDFLPVLFPTFIRGHFRKDEMSRFLSENIEGFTVNGVERSCAVELFSGPRFTTTFSISAKFFTAKNAEVLQHWHMTHGSNNLQLQSRSAVPIGLDIDGGSQKEDLKKKAREYIQAIIQEPAYAEQVTDSLRQTELPRKVLRIIQNYSYRCESPIVKRALSIYAMHYVMTRHLCLTRQTIVNLSLAPQDVPWVTPRVLNRQIKAVVDEMMMREIQLLFENFSKSLKPKSRKEWAPCLAAFLVLTLFMESVETAADTFVCSQTEVNLRNGQQPQWKRSFAFDVNREVENLPFKQFAYQFHQIYQTHSKDASTKSFNPLLDDACFAQGELDQYGIEMVLQLRKFIVDPGYWSELDFLSADPVLPDDRHRVYPHNVSFNYTGRLLSKFLLSFKDESYIFGPA